MFLLLACADDLPPIPEGLAAIEDNSVAFPAGQAEELVLETGEEDDYDWVHASGYVHAPLSDVWAAVQTEDVFVDRRQVGDWDITWDTEAEYDVSYVVHNTVYDVITVEYDTAWRESLVYGTEDDMQLVAIRFEKIDGTDVIERMVGSLHLEKVDEGVTSWSFVEHLKALQRSPDPIAIFAQDFFDEVVLTIDGEPLPDYSEEED